ncbi:probable disease resistance protein RF45 isoform X1 [Olea europaea var. sylvestris]|uniref:probable disease resistance protein RF45 isoform X1 n=1 Tax=Olea europaea var. sylvestris TaxID=158386 RepID=UPI000C1CFB17|nr:probable disease resistance protein RF45 isoform X1 [Olea europaea var. sylvestris]XP_022860491.1 probable disease resistance protein RF45 isoform X1 [Olea europaea var. sylvestris]XP_022860492.1 probable disease resistance protein RF45 isoform X1 [Olea europaea var. sylvestris]XP_022860493.1 probable disease resistance protein RF45 isoform X1 [Olea europaea var. sylvestris]XP_022860494.1 probable disease resistance protein RF45 isoform X1 [Olea europaea var. sylvestris]
MAEALIKAYEQKKSAVLLREFGTNLFPDIKKRIQDVQAKLNLWLSILKELDARKSEESSLHYNLEIDTRDLVSRLQNVHEIYFNEVQLRRDRSIIRKFIDVFKFFWTVDLEVKDINFQILMIIDNFITASALTKTEKKRPQSANVNPETENRQKLRKSISDDSRENHIVGMDEQITALQSVLLDGKEGVTCIYGSGGIGKTTLALKLYGNPFVQNHFYICARVEIGQNFKLRNVLRSILEQIPQGKERIKRSESNLTLETVAEYFNKYAKGMRYLFILDDIRSLDDWKFLHRIFPNVQNGSKLLLTTRLSEVALSADGFVHVQPLGSSDSLELFQKAAFLGDPDEDIAREVLDLCFGIPSAIVAVREVLAAKRTLSEWEMVLLDIKLLISRDLPVEQIVLQKSISALSFDDLPYDLKPCFLYLGLFPKGSKIEVEHLYLLWMAERTISRADCQTNETTMDLAERCLSVLVQKQMVEVEEEETPTFRKYKSCSVHKNMQDHCLLKGKEYFFKVLDFGLRTQRSADSDSFSLTSNPARRMAVHLDSDSFSTTSTSVDQFRNEEVTHLRSLLLLNQCDLQTKLEWPRRMFDRKKYRMLTVLNFERVDFQERGLPRAMAWPIYLRYLSFKGCNLGVLPSSTGNLSFLEILDLRVSSQIIIPNVLRKLGKLVYLYLPLMFQTPNNEKLYLGSLKELEILENFDTVMCNVADLFEMMSLRHLSTTVEGILGDLEQIISRMDMTSEDTSVMYPSIKVNNLDCYTEERHSVFRKLLNCQILHTLSMDGHLGQLPPHNKITQSLTKMVLIGSQLKEDPMTTLDKLPELQVLVLQDDAFVGSEMSCFNFSFKKLKRLELLTLRFLETWVVQKKAMPMLSILAVKNCRKLRSLPHGLRKRVSSVTFENDN